MRFHNHLSEQQLTMILSKLPKPFTKHTNKEGLALGLGAAMYTPGTRTQISEDVRTKKFPQLTTLIIDLEDAVADHDVALALENTYATLLEIDRFLATNQLTEDELPLLFVRARTPKHLEEVVTKLRPVQHLLTGYVMPKFELENGAAYLHVLKRERAKGYQLYAMPVLETANLLYKENRLAQLKNLHELLHEHREMILNVRIGATDFLGVYGIRRKRHQSLYDVLVLRDGLTDILNIFGRQEDGFIISGAVWEYFDSPTTSQDGPVATKTLTPALQGLQKECELDKLNGFQGKTVIHPTHVQFVNAYYAVSQEDYADALAILDHAEDAGVLKSTYGNKMNEMKPHHYWATRIVRQAEMYGVLLPQKTHFDLM